MTETEPGTAAEDMAEAGRVSASKGGPVGGSTSKGRPEGAASKGAPADATASKDGAAGRAGAERGATFRDVFAVAEFRVLFGSFALLVAGDSVKMLALSVLVFEQTGSPGLSAAAYS